MGRKESNQTKTNTRYLKDSYHILSFLSLLNDLIGLGYRQRSNEQWHEISNNVVCGTSKSSDQPAHMRSLIRAFASRLNIL